MKNLILVSAVLLISGQKVLLAQRPEGKTMASLWEFPGGKVEAGESPEAALIRECEEELGISISAQHLTPLSFASHEYESFHLLMPLYACRQWHGEPHGREGQALIWANHTEIDTYPMPAADIPLLPAIKRAMRDL